MAPYAPSVWMIIPFVLLLGLIALGPLWFPQWWMRYYPKAAFGLGAITLGYYVFGLPAAASFKVLNTAHEYISFIMLIGSLFVVSGGIHIRVKGEATPLANVVLLFIGAVVANVLGTTGASMLLLRPWLRMNRYRVTGFHVVFFIFIVSNVGGCLTPVGDPPLFLGYLNGIPFWWVLEHCWQHWLVAVSFLLVVFYILDRRNYMRAPKPVRERLAEPPDQWRFEGLWNLVFLSVILGAIFVQHPLFVREGLMAMAAVGSYFSTARSVHTANDFNFHPIREVAILFAGIFATMIPALDWLQQNAGSMGQPGAGAFYWACGTLSSVLDNAPTYLSFLSAIFGAVSDPACIAQVQQLVQSGSIPDLASLAEPVRNTLEALQRYHPGLLAAREAPLEQVETAYLLGNAQFNSYIVAVSIGAVFFGANTYIGNGPNFMVKSIADQQKVHTPTFLGYIVQYTIPVMLPTLVLVWWLFFR